MKKIIMDKNTMVELDAQAKALVAQVKTEVEAIVKTSDNDQLLEYIQSRGTKVVRLKNAAAILRFAGEEEGLITEQRGFKRLLFGGAPLFVLRTGEINRFSLLQQFYKWYSLQKGLPGFDYAAQKLFRKSMRSKHVGRMNLEKLAGLKEAIARDREATDWAYEQARAQDGTKQAFDKLNNGGANI
jgi:hypothetical protein